MFNKIKIGFGKPAAGKLLISEPFMFDNNFKRTVILITEHNEDGTIGFILNKKSEFVISDLFEDFPTFEASVNIGGPVQPDTLHFIHTAGNLLEGSKEIAPSVYWGGDFEILKILIRNKQVKESEIRFFVGYSGWGTNQLGLELKEKSWILSSADKDYIFKYDTESLWKMVLKDMGKEYEMLSNFPENPHLN